VLLPSTAWFIPHLGVSSANRNSSRVGAIAHISNRSNSSSNSNNNNTSISKTVLLLHCCSRLPSVHHNRFLPTTFHVSIVGRWGTLLENAASLSNVTHRELRHPWLISRGANRRVLHHGLAVPNIPPWRGFPWEKNRWRVCSSSTSIPLLFCSILEQRMIL
jgi:hypothetical protein